MTDHDIQGSESGDIRRIRARIYEAYHTTTSAHAPTHSTSKRLLAQLGRQFGRYLPPDRSVPTLDIGCGSGEFVLFLQQRGYSEAEGIDVSLEQITLARERGVRNVRQDNVFSYVDKYANHFSLITAFNILEHLDRPEMFQLMDLVVRALRPGGRFFAMVPNANGLFGSQVRYADFTHEMSFTPLSVLQLCQVVDLRIIRIFENGPVPHGLPSALRWAVWQVIRGGLLMARIAEGADWKWPVFTQDLLFVAERPYATKTPG